MYKVYFNFAFALQLVLDTTSNTPSSTTICMLSSVIYMQFCLTLLGDPQIKKLRVVLQEREVTSLNYFEVFLTTSNNFVGLSCSISI